MRLSPLSALISSLLAVAGCGSSSSTPDASTDAPVAPRDVRAVSDVPLVDDQPEEDVVPCAMRPDASNVACVLRVRGRAVDTAGAGLGNGVVTYCSTTCYATNSDMAGEFTVPVGDFINTTVYSLLIHGRPDHASLYVRSPAAVDGVVTMPEPIAVPRYVDMGPLLPMNTAGGTFTAGDVTLVVAPGTTLEFDLEDSLLGELGRRLRVAYVPMAQAPRFARDANLSAVWALGPFNLLADRPVGVRVANRAGLAAGSAVEFVVLGQDILREPPTAGATLVAATGRVSADGMSVTTDPGMGISFVTWIGIRPLR
jgi:hypothetical protein